LLFSCLILPRAGVKACDITLSSIIPFIWNL
jgi:hypothetical protein